MQNSIMIDARCVTDKPCGVRRVAEQYLANVPRQYNITILINESSLLNLAGRANVRIIRVPNLFKRFNFILDMVLVSFLVAQYRPNLFISLHSFLPVFSWLPKKRVFLCHDHFAAINRDFFEKRGRWAGPARLFFWFTMYLSVKRASRIITPSHFVKDSLLQFFSPAHNKVAVCYNPVKFYAVKTPKVNLVDRVDFLFVGNSRKYKGLDILLEAWSTFIKNLENESSVHLHIVSNETVEQLEGKFADLDLCSVSIYSRIKDVELDELREKTSVFVVPSREEGFGLPVIENIAWNKPIILSDIPVFREIVNDINSDAIIWFDSNKSSSLLEKLYLSKKQFEAYKGFKLVSSNYDLSQLDRFREDIASLRFFSECTGEAHE